MNTDSLQSLALTGTFCNLVGLALKKAPWAPNWTIPFILPVVGAVVQCGLTDHSFAQAIHGAITGSAAVGVHQAFRQVSHENRPPTP